VEEDNYSQEVDILEKEEEGTEQVGKAVEPRMVAFHSHFLPVEEGGRYSD
jgi:hypothetical protein